MSGNSQIIASEKIKELVKDIKQPVTPEGLVEIKKRIYARLEFRPYNNETKAHEAQIRWKRTAGQILDDGYVYAGKACTDIVVLFLAACAALGLSARFVKVKNEKTVHSVAEVELEDGWHIYDVSIKDSVPESGEITADAVWRGWRLWKKGRDAWDLGLVDFESIKKME